MTSKIILLAGLSSGAPMLKRVQSELREIGVDARLHVSPAPVSSRADWPQADIFVSLAEPCGAAEMDKASNLLGIVSPLVGYDWLDMSAATDRGIAVANGEVPENRESLAEATIMLMLALRYRLFETAASLRDSDAPPPPPRHMLKGTTVGIIGSGGVASAVMDRLASWGCRILASTRGTPSPRVGVDWVSLDQLLAESDVLMVLTSLTAATHHLIDANAIAKMRPHAVLVNTSRGAILDETALVAALQERRLGGAALDVFEAEPLARDHPLRALPNVILTQHCIGHTVESHNAMPEVAVQNVLTLLDGRLPQSCRNPQIAPIWRERFGRRLWRT